MNMVGRKRVLLVVRHPVGGIRTYFKYIYGQEFFDQLDFTVASPDQDMLPLFEELFENRNFIFLHCANSVELFKHCWGYLRKNKVDLVHSHGYTAGAMLVLPACYFGVPHLMTAHDVFQKNQFEGYKGKIKKWMLSLTFKRIDAIHTVSHDCSDNLLEYMPSLNRKKIYTILHGVDVDAFYNAPATDFEGEINQEDVFLIGFFGRFMSQKGFRYLVDAIEMIVHKKLVQKNPLVLTFGWGGFVREEFKSIEGRGLKEYFMNLPFTDNMPGAIKGVDMVVMPSLWEACGLLAMEALVAGVPIVGANCIGLREVLRDTPAAMVPPRDPKALSEAIVKEMNGSRKSEFSRYAPIAMKRFSLERPASELKGLYDKLISD